MPKCLPHQTRRSRFGANRGGSEWKLVVARRAARAALLFSKQYGNPNDLQNNADRVQGAKSELRGIDMNCVSWVALGMAVVPILALAAEPLSQNVEAVIVESPPCAFPSKETSAVDMMQRAATCLDEKKMAEAVPLYFAGQIRLRTLAVVDKNASGALAMLSSFTHAFGPAVNGWAGGDIPGWMISLGDAIAWDQRTPFKELDDIALKNFRNVAEAHDIHARVRASIHTLIGKIRDDRSKIYARRDEQQFLVRDAWWTDQQRDLAGQAMSKRPTAESATEPTQGKLAKEKREAEDANPIKKQNQPDR